MYHGLSLQGSTSNRRSGGLIRCRLRSRPFADSALQPIHIITVLDNVSRSDCQHRRCTDGAELIDKDGCAVLVYEHKTFLTIHPGFAVLGVALKSYQ